MTPQESKMLQDLMARVDSTRLQDKDPEAAQQVEQWIARNRDAAYILAQTVLVQNYALEQAHQQIRALQQQQQEPAKATSFLGSLFGHKEQDAASVRTAAPQQSPAQQGYTPVPQYGQQGYAAAPAYAPQPGGGSSFLRSAATTAAGVAAGALAFQGVESLMHGFGHAAGFGGGGFGGGFGGGEFGGRPEETIINNYYDNAGPGGAESTNADIQQFAHEDVSGLNTQQDLADDVNISGDDTQLASDNDLPTLDDSAGSYDDASLDDSSFDDVDSDFSNS